MISCSYKPHAMSSFEANTSPPPTCMSQASKCILIPRCSLRSMILALPFCKALSLICGLWEWSMLQAMQTHTNTLRWEVLLGDFLEFDKHYGLLGDISQVNTDLLEPTTLIRQHETYGLGHRTTMHSFLSLQAVIGKLSWAHLFLLPNKPCNAAMQHTSHNKLVVLLVREWCSPYDGDNNEDGDGALLWWGYVDGGIFISDGCYILEGNASTNLTESK